jgi:hypothetical protein
VRASDVNTDEVVVYTVGIFYCSVCAPVALSGEEVADRVERQSPAGTSNGWTVSDETTFAGGAPMPSPCDHDPVNRRHWLLAASIAALLALALPASARDAAGDVAEAVATYHPATTTHEPRALGAVMRQLARDGVIEPTDTYAPSGRSQNHNRPQRIWRSLRQRRSP